MNTGSRKWIWAALSILLAVACATSPTGRKQLQLVPDSQMNAMGVQSFSEIKAQTPVSNDPAINRYVQCVVQPIIAVSRDQLPSQEWEVVVFKDTTANAFALPGGKIGVHTGLLDVAKTDAQLAAVVGHEVGHVIAKHGGERVSQGVAAQGGLTVVNAFLSGGAVSPETRNLIMGGLGVGTQVGVLLPFSRTQESEADLIGLQLMAKAGFDPQQSVELWKNMKAAAGGSAPPEFLSTHPASDTRIQDLQKDMPSVIPFYEKAHAAGKTPSCQR